jgi:hypothetical protein
MREYDCRVCGETFTGLDARNTHEREKHTKKLDEFGITPAKFERPDTDSKGSRQRSLRFF